MVKDVKKPFEGFDSRMSEFFIELRFNNSKEWFDLNRQRYFEYDKSRYIGGGYGSRRILRLRICRCKI